MIELDNEKKNDPLKILNMLIDRKCVIPDNEKITLLWYKTEMYYISTLDGVPMEGLIKIPSPDQHNEYIATKLLNQGGEKVAIYQGETSRENFIFVFGGKLMQPGERKIYKGEPGQCHKNVARIWLKNQKKYSIVTGFALDPQNEIWVAHSWLIDRNGTIYDATLGFSLYYGSILDHKCATTFAQKEQ